MDLKKQVEALLFSSGKAMEEEQLMALTGSEKRSLRGALKRLQKEYKERDSALKVFNEGSLWKLLVRDEYIALVRRIVADTELSRATLETLAVIAYNQPRVLQSRVVELRGGNAYEHIKELLELGFITKEKTGRSFAIRLTEKFYDYFDVEGADSIRKVFKDVKAPRPRERQNQLGELAVVDVPEHERQEEDPLRGLAVVDVEEERPEEPLDEFPGFEEPPAETEEEEQRVKSDFLTKIESQIEALTRRNDEVESDESLKPTPEEDGEESDDTESSPEQDAAEATDGEQGAADDAAEEKK